jgi:integrase
MAGAKEQGLVSRNVAENISRVAQAHKDLDTYTEEEVQVLLAAVEDDRLGHAWELALSGLRRGEIAGLRWADIDLECKTLSIVNNRVMAAGRSVETTRNRWPLDGRFLYRTAWSRCCGQPRPDIRPNDWRSAAVRSPTW